MEPDIILLLYSYSVPRPVSRRIFSSGCSDNSPGVSN
ncbi:hypothetical protein AHF37_12012 [Paragonimus kellicotti]|nr:hypothetical protein AHF37_12012 [Paragonimus kellicotti]